MFRNSFEFCEFSLRAAQIEFSLFPSQLEVKLFINGYKIFFLPILTFVQ